MTHHADWFLTEDELAARGRDATTLPKIGVETEKNVVQVLVDGDAYFADLLKTFDELTAAGGAGYVFVAGLVLDPEVKLSPTVAGRTLRAELTKLAKKAECKVRVLVSGGFENSSDVAALNPATTQVVAYRDAMVKPRGQNDQRIVVVKTPTKLVAYCGSLDLTSRDRQDNRGHTRGTDRQQTDYPGGWHDVMLRVEGPAALEIDATFRQRWATVRTPVSRTPDKAMLPEHKDLPPAPAVTTGTGTHRVQVLRTFGLQARRYPFAPQGEFTAAAGMQKAIRKATKLIYIEDPLFTSQSVARWITDQLGRMAALQVVLVVCRNPHLTYGAVAAAHRKTTISMLQKKAPARVAIYHLQEAKSGATKDIYANARLMIIDDVWAGIGSVSMSGRGMNLDSGLLLGMVDDDVDADGASKFIRNLRLDLWSEHLGLALADPKIQVLRTLDKPKEVFAQFVSLASDQVALARKHTISDPVYKLDQGPVAPILWKQFGGLDPSDISPLSVDERLPTTVSTPSQILEANRSLGDAMRTALDDGYLDMKDKEKVWVDEMAAAGAFKVLRDPSDHTDVDVVMFLTLDACTLYRHLVSYATEHFTANTADPPFDILSMCRHPDAWHYGDNGEVKPNRGNHGLRMLSDDDRRVQDGKGRVVDGIVNAIDIRRYGDVIDLGSNSTPPKSHQKNLNIVVEWHHEDEKNKKSAKTTLANKDAVRDLLAIFDAKVPPAMRGVIAVVEALPRLPSNGEYLLGLPWATRSTRFADVDFDLAFQKGFYPDPMTKTPDEWILYGRAHIGGLTTARRVSPFLPHDAVDCTTPTRTLAGSAALVGAKDVRDAITARSDVIDNLVGDDTNHLHITVIPGGSEKPGSFEWFVLRERIHRENPRTQPVIMKDDMRTRVDAAVDKMPKTEQGPTLR